MGHVKHLFIRIESIPGKVNSNSTIIVVSHFIIRMIITQITSGVFNVSMIKPGFVMVGTSVGIVPEQFSDLWKYLVRGIQTSPTFKLSRFLAGQVDEL